MQTLKSCDESSSVDDGSMLMRMFPLIFIKLDTSEWREDENTIYKAVEQDS